MRFSIDPWDPDYATSLDVDLAPSEIDVNVEVETPASEWSPRRPQHAETPDTVIFIDGVRRVEARAWIERDGHYDPAIFASYAAGAVRCDGAAEIVDIDVRRGVFSAASSLDSVPTRAGVFDAVIASDGTPDRLSLALQDAMTATEVATAERVCRALDAPALVVIDGPLRGRQHLADAVGLVKTHHVRYLPDELDRVITGLRPGERTPLFLLRSSWSRVSWYVRLPGAEGSPWSGVVRCEANPELSIERASALADALTIVLPPFASTPHKDARAPQNLFPIAGLERQLRRRLGDATVVYRALKVSAA